MIGTVNGLMHPPVMKLYPAYEDFYFETPGRYTFTIPKGAKRMDVTVIGAGGGGAEGGANYNAYENASPAGSGAGGSGEMAHLFGAKATPGETVELTVGEGAKAFYGATGESNTGEGGTSSFGDMLTAAGGKTGTRGQNEPLDENSGANGGTGGRGGIGGNGGGAGWGRYSHSVGYDGTDGESTLDWENWDIVDWYVFKDPATGKRLGQGGRGGDGKSLGNNSTRAARGLTQEEAPGKMYGNGGRGGDQYKTGPVTVPEDGTDGLVAIRIHYKA